MKISCSKNEVGARCYCPNALGNGDLSLLVDFTGGTAPASYSGNMRTGIWRAGYRLDNPGWDLVEFGCFEHLLPDAGSISDWTQTLHVTEAGTEVETHYENGACVTTHVYCLLNCSLIVIRKKVTGVESFRMNYHFAPRRTALVPLDDVRTAYQIDTFRQMRGTVAFLSAGELAVSRTDTDITYECPAGEHVFYLAFDKAAGELALSKSQAELFAMHKAAWADYWSESRVPVAGVPAKVLEAARTSEYHLRISSTKWSIPTGIYPPHWTGRYFGFDEYFSVCGLLAAGHFKTARKVVHFRRSHLKAACSRAHSYFNTVAQAARYTWEALEEPGFEGAPQGFWLEHVFHEANIALEAWQCYLAEEDRAFLEDVAYPVMRGCAEFFRVYCVEEKGDGRMVIGKCTDLERLGAARENPFMTTCGAIATFRSVSEASRILGVDDDMRSVWDGVADALLLTLPVSEDGTAYIPYPGCREKSISLLSGVFPYSCLPVDDARQRKGIEDFVATESSCGNMYPVGKSLCTWYAGWKALVFHRLGEHEIAKVIVDRMAGETGCFSEVFEILEVGSHPWFTTGEGTLLQAICEIYG